METGELTLNLLNKAFRGKLSRPPTEHGQRLTVRLQEAAAN